jgi:hypothetical protein
MEFVDGFPSASHLPLLGHTLPDASCRVELPAQKDIGGKKLRAGTEEHITSKSNFWFAPVTQIQVRAIHSRSGM